MKKQSALNLKTNDVESIIRELGIVVVASGREISCQCPFHPDKHPSFSINSESGLWICYQCSSSGTLQMLVEQLTGVSNSEDPIRQIKRSRYQAPRTTPETHVERQERVQEEPQDPYYLYAKYMSFSDPPDWALAERYIDRAVAEQYGLRWQKGWVIPIWAPRQVRDLTEDFWGWQFKRMDHVANYPPGIKKSRTLFGITQVKGRKAVLVESPLDVVRMASAGIDAVASYGAMVSHYQMGLLEARFDRLTLALDNDQAGWEQTQKIWPKLYRKMPVKLWKEEGDIKDPGDMTDEQLLEVFG